MSKTKRKGLDFGNNKTPEPDKYNTNIWIWFNWTKKWNVKWQKKAFFQKKIVNKKSPSYSPFGFINEEEVLPKKNLKKIEKK